MQVHRVSKNVPHLTCYNYYIFERILTIFDRTVTDKVNNRGTLYYYPWMSANGQGTKWRRNIAENFKRVSRAHERRQMNGDSIGLSNSYTERVHVR